MNIEEQEGANRASFFSKIKRGFVGNPLQVTPEAYAALETQADNVGVLIREKLSVDAPASSVEAKLPPPVQPIKSEEVEELVITCEGVAGPQVRRTRGYGPTITHASCPKVQSQWLLAEVEAVAIANVPVEEIPSPEVTPSAVAPEPINVPQAIVPEVQPTTGSTPEPRKISMTSNLNESLNELMKIDGSMAVALVDGASGMAMGTAGGNQVNLEVAAAGNSEVVRSKHKVMKALNLNESIEDILISLGSQYHLIRPLAQCPDIFIYLVLNRSNANLAMARFKLAAVEKQLEI